MAVALPSTPLPPIILIIIITGSCCHTAVTLLAFADPFQLLLPQADALGSRVAAAVPDQQPTAALGGVSGVASP